MASPFHNRLTFRIIIQEIVPWYLDVESLCHIPLIFIFKGKRVIFRMSGHKYPFKVAGGHQVYVVCPLIQDSPSASYASLSLHSSRDTGTAPPDVEKKSVEAEMKRLRQGPFKHRRIGLLHGKMKPAEKQAAMLDFAMGKTDILVSTTVVEVGVDVPNATVMIIEGADTFGLAQLHQLRGRVGRSELQSHCYLVPSTSQKPSRRLRKHRLR